MATITQMFEQLTGTMGGKWFSSKKNSKGKTITIGHVINMNPKNPRTSAQQQRRAKFANAVKFYKRAVKNFYIFAFQDRKSNESDYNAFMRHNIDRSAFIDKSLVDKSFFPALAVNWQMAEGDLMVETPEYSLNDNGLVVNVITNNGSTATIGELSTVLMKNFGLQKGDIVTFVTIASEVTSTTVITDDTDYLAPLWTIYQMEVNQLDETLVSAMAHTNTAGTHTPSITWGGNNISIRYSDAGLSLWGCVIITRPDGARLYCKTSYLQSNPTALALILKYTTNADTASIYSSWLATSKAILAGNISGTTDQEYGSGTNVVSTVNGSADMPYNTNVHADTDVSFALVGLKIGTLTQSSFTVSNGEIKSFTVNSDTSATLVIHTGDIGSLLVVSVASNIIIQSQIVSKATVITAAAITSVNGTTSFPLAVTVTPDEQVKYTLTGTSLTSAKVTDFTVTNGQVNAFSASSDTSAYVQVTWGSSTGAGVLYYKSTRIVNATISASSDL